MVDQPKKNAAVDAVKRARELRNSGNAPVADLSEYDEHGYMIINDKRKLVGKGLMVLEYTFAPGDYGRESVYVRAVTDADTPIVFRDSSTGILKQLQNAKPQAPFYVPRGLRVSEYENQNNPGQRAQTFYLDTDVK